MAGVSVDGFPVESARSILAIEVATTCVYNLQTSTAGTAADREVVYSRLEISFITGILHALSARIMCPLAANSQHVCVASAHRLIYLSLLHPFVPA